MIIFTPVNELGCCVSVVVVKNHLPLIQGTWFAERLGSVHKYLVGGGGWAKWRGAKKVLSYQKGGTKKFSVVKGGGQKKFSQIESIMKIKIHYLYFKINRI